MKRFILAAALCGSLVACDQFKQMTGQTLAGVAGGATVAAVTPETRDRIAGLCQVSGAALDVASSVVPASSSGAKAVLKETAVYGDAYCAPVLAGLPLPPTTDKNTVSWLQTIIDALPSLARTAQVVLPAIMGR